MVSLSFEVFLLVLKYLIFVAGSEENFWLSFNNKCVCVCVIHKFGLLGLSGLILVLLDMPYSPWVLLGFCALTLV